MPGGTNEHKDPCQAHHTVVTVECTILLYSTGRDVHPRRLDKYPSSNNDNVDLTRPLEIGFI